MTGLPIFYGEKLYILFQNHKYVFLITLKGQCKQMSSMLTVLYFCPIYTKLHRVITVELKRWEKTNPDSIKNRCNLHWFSIKFQPFVVELMPLKTPLWDEISNLIPQVKVGKKHPLMLG